jgi:hypothetical protein
MFAPAATHASYRARGVTASRMAGLFESAACWRACSTVAAAPIAMSRVLQAVPPAGSADCIAWSRCRAGASWMVAAAPKLMMPAVIAAPARETTMHTTPTTMATIIRAGVRRGLFDMAGGLSRFDQVR